MPAAMLRPTSARSLWPSLSYTAGAPTATVSWLRWPSTQVSVRGADRAALCGRRAGRKDFLKSHTRYRTGGDGRHVGVAGIHNGADPDLTEGSFMAEPPSSIDLLYPGGRRSADRSTWCR